MSKTMLRNLSIPLISLIILTLGSALLTTFLSLKLQRFGVNSFLIGGLSAAYYGGMIIGAFRLERIILTVGHIRAYSAFSSMLAIMFILHSLYINAYFWLVLRFAEGFATAGLYVVIESWILSATHQRNRGSALAFYMIALYIAQALGQWLLNLEHISEFLLYCLASILASLSVIPMTLIKVEAPTFSEPETLGLFEMLKLSPSGVTTCFASGLLLGSLYGLYPIFIQTLNYSISGISTVMGVMILGGMLFQYPFGKLSDFISRRYVIAALSFSTVVLTFLLFVFEKSGFLYLTTLSFLLGGSTFCLYPIGISHACDRINSQQLVSAAQTLLFFYGIGAVIGPVITPACNHISNKFGVLIFIGGVSFLLAIFAVGRKHIHPSVPDEEKHGFVLSAETTPVASELDPRIDNKEPE